MRRVELLAYPAGHSVSPDMHNAAFESLGLPVRYLANEVPPQGLGEAVAALRSEDVLGANVTVPHKEAVMPLLDSISGQARALGSVNTIVTKGGALEGHNTDVTGFLRALHDLGFEPAGRQVLLLGAGGAARAIAYALLSAGAARVSVSNRNADRALALARDLEHLGAIRAIAAGELEAEARGSELVVNATSVGMEGGSAPGESPLPPGCFPPEGVAVDIVYRPVLTPFLREAQLAGMRVQNGLPMLVHQGAESFTLWTGRPAPTELMRRAAERALGTGRAAQATGPAPVDDS